MADETTPTNPVIRMVALQFSFSNPMAIPSSLLKRSKEETLEKKLKRKSHSSGKMFGIPAEQCSVEKFMLDLQGAGFELVDAFYESRINPNDSHAELRYHMVRFVFVRKEFVKELSEEFIAIRPVLLADLYEMTRVAFWRVRTFFNPFYENSVEVTGQSMLSVNLEVRVPRFLPDGSPVVIWKKDAQGERVGDAPLPIQPKFALRFQEKSPLLARLII